MDLEKLVNDILRGLDKLNAQQCLNMICENMLTLLGADVCIIYLIDRSEETLFTGAYLDRSGGTFSRRIKFGKGIAGWVASNQKPLVVQDVQFDSRYLEEFLITNEKSAKESLREGSILAMPLVAFESFLGVIEVINKKGRKFFDTDVSVIQPLVNIAALAIPKETHESFLKLAEVCVRFLEEKDRYTHGHSLRVMKYSMVIADEILLPQNAKEELRLCALLHDIGKVVIKDALLSKPGQLSKQELMTIRMHPTIGFNIVEKISKNLSRKILSHHERWDGKGYPEGLKGEEIPLISRIIAIADTLDAITTDRPYRPASDVDYAIKEIFLNSGTQFDPVLVDAIVSANRNGKLKILKV